MHRSLIRITLNSRVIAPRFQSRKIWVYTFPNKPQGRVAWWFRHLLRIVPITFITYTVYKTGYAMGLQDYAQDPVKMDTALMNAMAGRIVGRKEEEPNDKDVLFYSHESPEHRHVSRIAIRVLAAAKSYAEQQRRFYDVLNRRQLAYHDVKSPDGAVVRTVKVAEYLNMWETACEKLSGNWNVVVIRHDGANAFVSDLCPRRIFVHVGLLTQCNPTDDELGLVLSHEISHLLLGHVSSAMETVFLTSLMQLIFLSFVDPFGILTLFLDYYSFQLVDLFTAYHSRARELEADALGLEVASLACFDVEKGAHIFRKFSELEAPAIGTDLLPAGERRKASWFDSHPASDHRFSILDEASKHYKHMHASPDCVSWQQEFEKAIDLVFHPKTGHGSKEKHDPKE